ncbi:hypothetical protein C2E25_04585 [Geothermobacter hydrogeniphilus]|uniref:Uncharacterized protein n=1 Tax=Geothermobacter hydrogeniphilus TaxID=1969733 RepID=A0A2K2HC37_9BACT|nr:hypothetical protein [Geothermobacter hydrogeniphilus]PNU20872.1 hypothetical protein C2E25_04585 [Geothermobacter hydrogeniphilus]
MRLALKYRNSRGNLIHPLDRPRPVTRERARNLRRRLLLHILPFILMLLAISWLSLMAGHSIEQSKLPSGYATLERN